MTDQLDRGNGAKLHYEYDAPAGDRPTFVFVNAITGSTAQWQSVIGPALRAEGFGTLAYNMRGQENSPALVEEPLEEAVHVEDLGALLDHVAPPRPILTGLSIGGLFATKAFLGGAPAAGFVYLNTLRAPGLALDWVNEAIFRAAGLGGPALVMDLFLPMLVGPAYLARMRGNRLGAAPYQPPGPEDGVVRLLSGGREANWNVDWSRVVVPVLNVTGLQDRVFYNGADVARLAALMPNLEHVALPEIGHLVPAEAPETLASLLLGFGTRIHANRKMLS